MVRQPLRLFASMVWTSIAAWAVYAVGAVIYEYRLITLDDLAAWLSMPR